MKEKVLKEINFQLILEWCKFNYVFGIAYNNIETNEKKWIGIVYNFIIGLDGKNG